MSSPHLRLLGFAYGKRAQLKIAPFNHGFEAQIRWRFDDKRDFRESGYGTTPELALDKLCELMEEVYAHERR